MPDPLARLNDPTRDATPPATYSDLRALILNCTLKRSPELSHTEGLLGITRAIMEKHGWLWSWPSTGCSRSPGGCGGTRRCWTCSPAATQAGGIQDYILVGLAEGPKGEQLLRQLARAVHQLVKNS